MARGKGRQPVRVAPGGGYGDRQTMVQQQQAAPIPQIAPQTQQQPAQPSPGGQTAPAPRGPGGPVAYGEAGVFSASARPGEALTAGIPWGQGHPGPTMPALRPDQNQALRDIIAVTGESAITDYLLTLWDS